jgi:pSer/pThr/pTyr-binding forkhead associated (FHA) protein
MSDPKSLQKKSFSPDWLVRGVLTKLGDTFDRLTGRGWKPSSSLATSELIERLKKLLDSEIREVEGEGRFVPHNIKLKMQWDKFSTDSDTAISKLEHELLTAAVDHINDNLYHTYAPLKLEIKPDYFTEGVKLLAGFENFAEEEHEAELNVTIPAINVAGLVPKTPAEAPPPAEPLSREETFIADFAAGTGPKKIKLVFGVSERKSVGRAGSNDLSIDNHSVSKIHASLVMNAEGQLMVADTGSTNGTFINGERISYGKAYPLAEADVVRFGLVEVRFERVEKPAVPTREETSDDIAQAETIAIGEFEFKKKIELPEYPDTVPIDEEKERGGERHENAAPAANPEKTGDMPEAIDEQAVPDQAQGLEKKKEDR